MQINFHFALKSKRIKCEW